MSDFISMASGFATAYVSVNPTSAEDALKFLEQSGDAHVKLATKFGILAGEHAALGGVPAGQQHQIAAPINNLAAQLRQIGLNDISDTIQPEFLICIEDGKKLKMMKRHLMSSYGMTPDQYRNKWSLQSDYPMVAAGYAAKRSNLAKELGLGKKDEATLEARKARKTAIEAAKASSVKVVAEHDDDPIPTGDELIAAVG